MKHLKLIVLLFSLSLFSCARYVKIIGANKMKHVSGLKNGEDYVDYALKIDAKNDFSFQNIYLNETVIKESLYVKYLATGFSSTGIKNEYKKGNYLFGFRIFNTEQTNVDENLKFIYKIKDKEYSIDTTVKKNNKVVFNR